MSNTPMKDLKIQYEGQAGQIDATTFINSLLHLSNLIQEANKELHPDKKIEVKINALQPGSFIVDIVLQTSLLAGIGNLFTKENLTIASEIAGVIGGLLALKQFLKKEKPSLFKSNSEEITLKNSNGNTITLNKNVYNIYINNGQVQDSLAAEFEVLNNDPSIEGLSLYDREDKLIFHTPREEFADMASNEIESVERRPMTRQVTLNILRLSFEKGMKWEFYYDGNKISAKMEDDSFFERIDKGEQFAKGDSLEAEIEITQQYEKSVDTFINKSYRVLKIINHFPRSSQGKLDFGE